MLHLHVPHPSSLRVHAGWIETCVEVKLGAPPLPRGCLCLAPRVVRLLESVPSDPEQNEQKSTSLERMPNVISMNRGQLRVFQKPNYAGVADFLGRRIRLN